MTQIGRHLLNVGQVQVAKAALARRTTFAPDQRTKVAQAETTGKLNKLEDWYRKELVRRQLFAEGALPPAKYPMQVAKVPHQANTSAGDSTRVSGENAESPQSSGKGARTHEQQAETLMAEAWDNAIGMPPLSSGS